MSSKRKAEYLKYKRKVLKQLGVVLTPEQKAHMAELNSEVQIDNYAHDLIHGVMPKCPAYI